MAGGATQKFKTPGPQQCHPSVGAMRPAYGCLPVSVLEAAAKKLNITTSNNNLRQALEKQVNVMPVNEYSFLMALPFSDSEKQTFAAKYLRPKRPEKWTAKPNMWLDSTNITSVLNQYEEAYSKFEFMGPFPIDFAAPNPYKSASKKECLITEICELRVTNAIKNGTEMIGIVYNLDPHFKSGSHWVANFIDLKRMNCFYFDSYGMKAPKQIEAFMTWLADQDIADGGKKMTLSYNAKRLQYSNTECGMYCLYFIIRMLMGDEFVTFSRQKPRDNDMLQMREWLYST